MILDASPASKGHALILPKEHYADIYDIDEEVAGKAMKLAKKLAGHMTEVLAVMDLIFFRTITRLQDRQYSTSICI